MEPGEYAVRGGILDLFPPGRSSPVRLDFFGDTLEHIKAFDPETQRTGKIVQQLDPDADQRGGVRRGGREALPPRATSRCSAPRPARTRSTRPSAPASAIPAWSTGCRCSTSSWRRCSTTSPDAPVSFDHLADEAVGERLGADRATTTRRASRGSRRSTFGAPPYKPVPPAAMFLTREEWAARLRRAATVRRMTPSSRPTSARAAAQRALVRRPGRAQLRRRARRRGRQRVRCGRRPRAQPAGPGQARDRRRLHAGRARAAGGAARRARLDRRAQGRELRRRPRRCRPTRRRSPCSASSRASRRADLAVIGEQDILGDRLVRPRRKARRAADVITEATSLAVGDLVVHADHGIGRFDGLKTITALGAPHDCLEIAYAGGDKLYLPVENIELLSRYGSGRRRRRSSTGSAASPGRRARRASSSASARSPPS